MVDAARAAHLTSGVVAAALTPLRDDLAADARLLAAHGSALIERGCNAVVVLGTTGEGTSFGLAERERLLEELLAAGLAADRIIVGTGCPAVADSARLIKHALSLGVSRMLLLPPYYYKNVSDQGAFAAAARTIELVGDEHARVYLYQIPALSGVEFSVDVIATLVTRFPKVVAGIKDSSGDWPKTKRLCERFAGELDVLVGDERYLLDGLAAGASGCVSATANLTAMLLARAYARRAEPAGAGLLAAAVSIRTIVEAYPMVPALKECLARRTGVAAWRNVRPPLTPLAPAQAAELAERLAVAEHRLESA